MITQLNISRVIAAALLTTFLCDAGVSFGDETTSGSSSSVLDAVLTPAVVSQNCAAVRKRAASLDDEARYEYLTAWVLPETSGIPLRLNGNFTSTFPSPAAFDSTLHSDRNGGEVVSPVIDLLNVAKRLNRFQELTARLDAKANAIGSSDQKGVLALRALILLWQKDYEAIEDVVSKLSETAARSEWSVADDYWPEFLVAWTGIHNEHPFAIVDPLIELLSLRASSAAGHPLNTAAQTQINALVLRKRHIESGGNNTSLAAALNCEDWVPATLNTNFTRGHGQPPAIWQKNTEGSVTHLAGHQEDYLLYRAPLTGNFEAAGEITGFGSIQFMAADQVVAPRGLGGLWLGTLRQGVRVTPFDPPFTFLDHSTPFRTVFNDETIQIFMNGRSVCESPRTGHESPWIGVRGWWSNAGGVRTFLVAEDATIPESVSLTASKYLSGWIAYCGETINAIGATWHYRNDSSGGAQIVGMHQPWHAGTQFESLLQYFRPLDATASVTYDFFYEQGRVHTHPAIDRLALLLDPDGVRVHWLTDSPFDRSEVAPGNSTAVTGSNLLPLRSGEWNQMAVAVNGELLTLILNGVEIYRGQLETTNNRTFGLFHFAEQSEVRVRNVLMRGSWPRTVPSPEQQTLTDKRVAEFDANLAKTGSDFEHSFGKSGLPPHLFTPSTTQDVVIQLDNVGVKTSITATGGWKSLRLRTGLQLHGDFDIEAAFEQLEWDGDDVSTVHLNVEFSDKDAHICRLLRMNDDRHRNSVQAQVSRLHQGQRAYESDGLVASEFRQGTLRLVRRGSTVFFLVAEGDGKLFRVMGERDITTAPTTVDGIVLESTCSKTSTVTVRWTDMRIAAEKLFYLPPAPPTAPIRTMHVLNVADKTVSAVTDPANGLVHLGSPEWSADSRTLVCDMSMGGTGTSHVVSLKPDGTELKDLGTGCMPSLSKDAREMVFSMPGIMRMNSDGTERKRLANGWGVQWSPDGKHIAWGENGNIVVMNVQTEDRKPLLTSDQLQQTGRIAWNFGWSHNSQSIAFKGSASAAGEQIVAAADIDSSDGFRFIYRGNDRVNEDFTWHPDNRNVVFSMRVPQLNKMRLVMTDGKSDEEPQAVLGIPDDWDTFDCDWSPDGKQIVFSAKVPRQPVEWSVYQKSMEER